MEHDAAQVAHLLLEPADADAWSVYADWLLDRGDIRGELIGLELAGADMDIERQRAEVLRAQLEDWFGPAARLVDGRVQVRLDPADRHSAEVVLTLRRGHVHRIELHSGGRAGWRAWLLDWLHLLQTPLGALCRELAVHWWPGVDPEGAWLVERLQDAYPRALERVMVVPLDDHAGHAAPPPQELLASLPRLTSLHIGGPLYRLESLAHASLGALRLTGEPLSAGVFRGLEQASLPALHTLELTAPRPEVPAGRALQDLVWAQPFPELRRLKLTSSAGQDELLRTLLHQKWLGNLDELGVNGLFWGGSLDLLLAQASALQDVKIRLSGCGVPATVADELREALPNLWLEG